MMNRTKDKEVFKINTITYLRGRPPAASASCRFHTPFPFLYGERVRHLPPPARPPRTGRDENDNDARQCCPNNEDSRDGSHKSVGT